MTNFFVKMGKYWPEKKFPRIRKFVSTVIKKIYFFNNGIKFYFWKKFSKVKFGEKRWIKIDWGELYVNCNDFRSYLIAKEKGTQKEKVNKFIKNTDLKQELII